ncbi:MAG TPA: gamma-glutamylcyclotransferase family protein [Polyangiaceae bacterium]|jgi:gamma-glutamylcyclotransferase (GGCT)/AIG2-like uncharacterized protein YtfP
MEATETRLFVYGSLKAGFEHHGRMRGARFEAAAATAYGYRLVVLEGYPALVAGAGAGSVRGELYWVKLELLEALDRFEDCPELYQRHPIALADGSAAQAYSISAQRAGLCPEIPGGAWTQHSSARSGCEGYFRSDMGTKRRSS